MRVAIVLLGASALLIPSPADAAAIFFRPGGRGEIGRFGGFGGRFGGFGGIGVFGGYGGYLGSPYSPLGLGYNPAGFGGYGYPVFYNYGDNWYPNSPEAMPAASWFVGPGSGGAAAATPRMRASTSAYPHTAGVADDVLIVSASTALPSEPAVIDVSLPAPGAQVWVQGARTTQAGMERRYVSPSLTAGSDYVYSIRARWRDPRGEVQVQQQNILVQAGSYVRVAFPTTR